jgi:hypothetical protein
MHLHHDASVVSVHFSQDGSQLLTATVFDGLTVWDVASGAALHIYRYAGSGVTGALLLP